MRKHIAATLCILLALICCRTFSLYAADQRVVRVGAFNYYPGIFKDSDDVVKGFYVDALAEVAQRENIRFEYVYGSWSEGLERIKSGEVDVITSVAFTPERAEFLDYAKTPLLTVWGELYVPLSSEIDGIRAMQGKKVAVMKSDFNASYFIELVKKFGITCEFIEMPGFEEVFKAIAAKKVDAGVVNNTYGVARQQEFGLRSTGVVFNPFEIFFAVAKGENSDLLVMLDNYLNRWRHQTDSTYNKARIKWSHGSGNVLHVTPHWVKTAISFLAILSLCAIAFITMLKRQVVRKTRSVIESSRKYQIISERQNAILAAVPDIIMEVDANKVYTWANAAGLEFFGDDVVGKEASYYFEGEQNTYKVVQPLFDKSEDVVYVENLQRRRDGTICLLAWWCKGILDEQGVVIGTLSSARDITESHQVREVDVFLAQAFSSSATEPFFAALARFLAQNLHMDYICINRFDAGHLDATTLAVWKDGYLEGDATNSLTDVSDGEVVGQKSCCFPASNCQLFPNDKALQELRAGNCVDVILWSHSGQPIGLITAVSRRGLTNRSHAELTLLRVAVRAAAELERLDAEAALRTIESRQAKMIANIGDVIVIIDQHGINRYKSPNIEKWFGWKPEELVGASTWDNVHPDDLKAAQKFLGALAERPGGTGTTELRYRCKDGCYKWIEIKLVNLLNEPDICGIMGNYHDITERKRAADEKLALELQLQQTQKLESLGVLAGGIAHDFNNILAIIIGYCSLTKMDYGNAEKHLPEIEKAAERAAALCRQMLAYAGKATLSQSQVNVRTIVDEMVSMLKTTIQQNVVIKPDLGTDLPLITGDASQLRQVIMNLIINAAEAIGDAEGEIDVRLATAEIRAEQSEKDYLDFIIPAGGYICFEVSDNGCGMDDDTMSKIFEPFYTTKFTGRGLGMSAVLGIIKAHAGALQLESRLGHGTTVRVYLPVDSSKPETEEEQQITTSASWKGTGTVLLAEDEVQVRSIAIVLLQELGFTVIAAANGKEALELYQQHSADITLVVTDMGMPVMNGYELFYKLKQLDPMLPIIVSSGFGEGDIASKIPREAMAGIINKPYSFDNLREVLRGCN